ncbi:MAG TPA: cation:proton antiporter [Pseudonocardiaceae bacterium]
MIDAPGLVYAVLGIAALVAALLPRMIGRLPVSMPMVFLGAGMAVFAVFDGLPDPDPLTHTGITVHLTEVCVIVSLMGAGLALDRPARGWGTTWRLLAITMPLSVVAVAVAGWWMLGLGVAAAVLLGAALAPTDPVLAGEVQVGEPADDPEAVDDPTRFALTSEAGLNDSLAFPFTYAAIAMAAAGAAPAGWLPRWLAVDVLWRVGIGLAAGLLIGWGLRMLFFRVSNERLRLAEHAEGFVALAATFLAYGLTELAEGYGFLAVFVCAVTIRAAERDHGYHRVLHDYVEQMERLLTVVVLLLLGGAIARGLLAGLGWRDVLLVAGVLLVARPLLGWLALAGGSTGPRERAVIAVFGVRGVGTLFYVAYGLQAMPGAFGDPARLWALAGLVVAGSVLLHGLGATPVMNRLDRRRTAVARARGDEDAAPATSV